MIKSSHRPTRVEVDLGAVRSNIKRLHAFARSQVGTGVEFGAVVKADGYGHGATQVAGAAIEAGATVLFVATLDEAFALRESYRDVSIVMLSEPDAAFLTEVVGNRVTPTIHNLSTLDAFIGIVERLSSRDQARLAPALHLEIETGLHRLGSDTETAMVLAQRATAHGVVVAGVYSHFARADEGHVGRPSVVEQTETLTIAYGQIARVLGYRPALHLANTAGLLNYPQASFDLIRVGIGMYGYGTGDFSVIPAMRLVSKVARVHTLVRDEGVSYGHRRALPAGTRIATIPIGYADGYRRGLFEAQAHVLIRGHRHRLAGMVAMDHLMVEVADSDVAVGDEVVLIGDQGSEFIGADELAGLLSTISYEIVTGISDRVPRVYCG